MAEEPPPLVDALPGAAHALARAVGLPPGHDARPALAALLEAAGGPDAGNAVRRHLERAPTRLGAGADAGAVVAEARRLHDAADADLRAALAGAGLGAAAGPGREERADYARRALDARRDAVHAVLAALAPTTQG